MPNLLTDAFRHHAWANDRLLEVCRSLTPEQLATPSPGTYGPILDTLRHLVSLGIEPPEIDVWAWGEATNRSHAVGEIPA